MLCATCTLPIAPDAPRIYVGAVTYHAPVAVPQITEDGTAILDEHGEPLPPVWEHMTCPPAVEPGPPAPPPAPTERWISLDQYQRRLEQAVPGILARLQLEACDIPTEHAPVRLMRAQLRADMLRFQTLDPAKGINLADPDTRTALQRMAPFGMTDTLIDTVVLR